jgi:hypothetical protein
MNDLIYSILKELFEGMKVNQDQISNSISQAKGDTNRSNLNVAWNYIRSEGILQPVDPSEYQNAYAFSEISDHGREVYKEEAKKRIAIQNEKDEQERLKTLTSQNLWYTTQVAKDAFDDYPSIKKKQNWALGVAIGSAIITLISLVAKCRN